MEKTKVINNFRNLSAKQFNKYCWWWRIYHFCQFHNIVSLFLTILKQFEFLFKVQSSIILSTNYFIGITKFYIGWYSNLNILMFYQLYKYKSYMSLVEYNLMKNISQMKIQLSTSERCIQVIFVKSVIVFFDDILVYSQLRMSTKSIWDKCCTYFKNILYSQTERSVFLDRVMWIT